MFVVKKMKKGIAYYYLRTGARIKGKVKITWEKYLGTAEKIKQDYEGGWGDLAIRSVIFGSVAAMLGIAEELDLKEIISKTVPDMNYKLKVWQHIIMQSICRFHEPRSKTMSINWYDNSILPLLWGKTFSSPQTILNQFDKMVTATHSRIPEIEEEICKKLLEKGIKPSVLVWDPTNFFTYIEKGEDLPQKGASKEKRYDKNIINLGLVVSDENIPLMHTIYDGKKHESKVVTDVVDGIHERLKNLGQDVEELIFVFDRGNNSKDNIPHIEEKFHFVGALKKNQLKHLFDIELSKFTFLYENKSKNQILGYRTTEIVYGKEYTIIVAYNEKTDQKQKIKTNEAVKKIQKKFTEMKDGFDKKKKGKKATVKGVAKRINDFLYKQYQSLFSWELDEANQKFTWKLNEAILAERAKTYGKTILFTDLKEWTSEQIAKTYNSKSIIEDDFKVLKNKLLIPVKPFFHHQDSHLRVHIFICVLSMIMYRYMLWKLQEFNLSEQRITEELRSMRLAFVKEKESNSVKKVLENMTPEQVGIYSTLHLEKYLPNTPIRNSWALQI